MPTRVDLSDEVDMFLAELAHDSLLTVHASICLEHQISAACNHV